MLQNQFSEYVRAGFAGIWIQSFEHDEAIRELSAECKQRQWTIAVWDVDTGLRACLLIRQSLTGEASEHELNHADVDHRFA